MCTFLAPCKWPKCNHSTLVFSSVPIDKACFLSFSTVVYRATQTFFLFPWWFQHLVYIFHSASYLAKFMAIGYNSITSQFLKFLNSSNLISTSHNHNHITLQVHKHWHFIVSHIWHVFIIKKAAVARRFDWRELNSSLMPVSASKLPSYVQLLHPFLSFHPNLHTCLWIVFLEM